jgi:hypothetical protein
VSGVLRVKNWKEFQHYKRKRPVWIKLYRWILDDAKYQALPDSAQSVLVSMWLLAAETDNSVPASSADIAWRIRRPPMHVHNDLEVLIAAGFLMLDGELARPILDTLELGYTNSSPETETETEKRQRQRQSSVASQPGDARSNGTGDLTDGELMGLVRQHLYVPNGQAPNGYSVARDVTIIRALRKQRLSGYQIADAIEGVRLMCEAGELGKKHPGEKLTMRALYNTRHGVRPLLFQAQEAAYQSQKRVRAAHVPDDRQAKPPEHISTAIDRLVPRKP